MKPALLKLVQQLFSTDRFRVYTNSDLVGVELGGAPQERHRDRSGICDGLVFGDNAKSALVTRGIVEITRFGVHCGAQEKTFHGLAGLGDLMTTCFSPAWSQPQRRDATGTGGVTRTDLASMAAVAEGSTPPAVCATCPASWESICRSRTWCSACCSRGCPRARRPTP